MLWYRVFLVSSNIECLEVGITKVFRLKIYKKIMGIKARLHVSRVTYWNDESNDDSLLMSNTHDDSFYE